MHEFNTVHFELFCHSLRSSFSRNVDKLQENVENINFHVNLCYQFYSKFLFKLHVFPLPTNVTQLMTIFLKIRLTTK